MKKTLMTVVLVLLTSVGVSAQDSKVGDNYPASIYCDTLPDMYMLVDLLNAGEDQTAWGLVAADSDFKCYFHQFSHIPFFPVELTAVVETRGDRMIYKGKLLPGDHEVFVFSKAAGSKT